MHSSVWLVSLDKSVRRMSECSQTVLVWSVCCCQWIGSCMNIWLHLWTSSLPPSLPSSFSFRSPLSISSLSNFPHPKISSFARLTLISSFLTYYLLHFWKHECVYNKCVMCHVVPVLWRRLRSETQMAELGCWGQVRQGHFLSRDVKGRRFPSLSVFFLLEAYYWPVPSFLVLSCSVTSPCLSDQMTGLEVVRWAPIHLHLCSGLPLSLAYGWGFVEGRRMRRRKSRPAEETAWRNGSSRLRMGVGWRGARSGHGGSWIGWQRSRRPDDRIWALSWLAGAALRSDAGSWSWRRNTGRSGGTGSSHPHPHLQPRVLMRCPRFPHCCDPTPPMQGPSSESQGTTQTCRQTSDRSPSWWCSAGESRWDVQFITTEETNHFNVV